MRGAAPSVVSPRTPTMMSVRSWSSVRLGSNPTIKPARPATNGAAIDVPSSALYVPPVVVLTMPTPGADTSPPISENSARALVESTASVMRIGLAPPLQWASAQPNTWNNRVSTLVKWKPAGHALPTGLAVVVAFSQI